MSYCICFFFFKQKTAYEMRISDWSSDVCSSDLPIRSAVLDIVEVGAGGGSIAWIDPGGVPKVGPESAGADPGPACYGKGGDLPTVTDAHAVIGTLGPETFDGPGICFSREAAVAAVEQHIARPMGWLDRKSVGVGKRV